MDFTKISDSDLLDLAASAGGCYDGVRIYGNGALNELVDAARAIWEPIKAEVLARGLAEEAGI